MRCLCGAEYTLTQSRDCPTCGRRVPKAVSPDGANWKTYAEVKLDFLCHMLTSQQIGQIPANRRDAARQNIEQQIRQLEDGSWKAAARQRVIRFGDMLKEGLHAGHFATLSERERQDTQRMLEMGIQTAREELEAAGETP